MENPYIPMPVEVINIATEVDTGEIKTLRLAFVNKEDEENSYICRGSSQNFPYMEKEKAQSALPPRQQIKVIWSLRSNGQGRWFRG